MNTPKLQAILAFALSATVVVELGLVPSATAAPVYNIVPLGLDDLEHTRDDGYKDSEASQLNEAGQVSGYSKRYNGDSIDLGQSAWLYNGATTIKIGLIGSEHTRNNGAKGSSALKLNEAGQVLGFSSRFNGGNSNLGQSTWLYNGANTINIGLTGSEHTRNSGYKYSETYYSQNYGLNEAGQVSGISYRYNGGSTDLGQSAWLYNGATTIDIGLTGSEHTKSGGYKYSETFYLNEAGKVSGRSRRYNGGSTDLGRSAWLYNGATTIDIGLTGSEHTSNNGYKESGVYKLSEAGQAIGYSSRFNGGSTDLGQSAWLYNGAATVDIGRTGSEYTRNDGYKYSYLGGMNEAGQVIGFSSRFNGSTDLGNSAWLYNGANTIDIGLTGSEHTYTNGYIFSIASGLNEAGQVIGRSQRYTGSTYLGESAWLYNGANTNNVGLTGSEHTRNDGYKESYAGQLNQAGQVIGYSYRYNGGSTDLGQSAWLYNGATTNIVGLVGSEHTRNDGYKFGVALKLNEAGQVSGSSQRYNGGSTQLGEDAWYYDPVLGQTFSLNLSTRSDGYAFSSANYLGEDGLVLGTYALFDTFDSNLGSRAFYFTIADGLHDLGSLVEGGLTANGWDWLATSIRANGLGQISGLGKLSSQSSGAMAYLLTPVPEPSTLTLTALAAAGLLRRRRIRKRF